MNYEAIKTKRDIEYLISDSQNPDGETARFELKGCVGRDPLKKEFKRLLSKEISAFANTYGGIICFHNGGDTELEEFPCEIAQQAFSPLEGWLKNSLEPLLAGIEVKVVDNIFLLNIPESKNKPHMANNGIYYYRHNSSSSPMPELMISSLYRSQDYLEFDIGASLQKRDSVVDVSVWVNNKSRVAGTKPRIRVFVAKEDGERFKFTNTQIIRFGGFHISKEPIIVAPFAITTQKYAEEVLYPEDNIVVGVTSTPIQNLSGNNLFLLEAECTFLQSASQSIYLVFEFEKEVLINTSSFDTPLKSQSYFVEMLNKTNVLFKS